ncbi:MAG: RhuM family protein, partial [Bacteroides sp.]|nr:RhuM family protein [Bacteroides sp.]
MEQGEIILYQPDEAVKLEVRLEDETVWLTQNQMAELFQSTKQNISLHTNNIFKEKELDMDSVVKESLTTASDGKRYRTKYYSLDVIISVGYRVKSQRGTQFRVWANRVLKDYLLKGYSINQRVDQLESKIDQRLIAHDKKLEELTSKVDFFVRTSLPPVEGIF